MKIFARIFALSLLVSAAFLYSGCGGGGGGTDSPEKIQLAKLTKTWTLSSAKLDGNDKTSTFGSPFKLTITGTYSKDGDTYTYSFSGTRPQPSPWPATGTWKFGSDPKTQLIRLDDTPPLSMNYTVTDTSLGITFTYPGDGFAGGRAEQVTGNWDFEFSN